MCYCCFCYTDSMSKSLVSSVPIWLFDVNKSHRGLSRSISMDDPTRRWCPLPRMAAQTKRNALTHRSAKDWLSILSILYNILVVECFMQILANSFFLDACQLSKSSDIQTAIFADQLNICLNDCVRFRGAVTSRYASPSVVSWPSLKPPKNKITR